jgi:mycofactocin system FadH/OYE family oxidoreductase 2
MEPAMPTQLSDPVSLGPVALRNRIVMLPHTTFYAEGGRPSDRHYHYYLERARGGVGLVTVECLGVQRNGDTGGTINAYDPSAMEGWPQTVRAVHAEGAKIFAQLTHFGVEASPHDSMLPMFAPSAVPSPVTREIPKAMDRDDLAATREGFAVSAANARAVGFDGIELKVAHDGLLRTFLSPYFNRREDEYGGTPENRVRFILETIAAVRAELREDMALGVRLSLDEGFPGGYGLEEGLEFARLIGRSGTVDYMTSDMGTWQGFTLFAPSMATPQGYADKATASMKEAAGVPIIAFGRIKRPDHAARILAEGGADLIGMTRQLIADPEWAVKALEGRAHEIRPCVACNQECIGRALRTLPISCVHNPAAGREERLGVMTRGRADRPHRVAVVGGGPAGLKAAESAALRGHDVILFERAERLGGQVALAATAPGHAEWGEIVQHLEARVRDLGVDVRCGTEATAETVRDAAPDEVVLATGARPGPWPFAARPGARILDEWQVLEGDAPRSERVVVLDLGVRYEPAAVVESLLAAGNAVHWVAPTPMAGIEIDPASLMTMLGNLGDDDLERSPETMIVEVDERSVKVVNVLTGRVRSLDDVDAVVVVGNKVSDNALAAPLGGGGLRVRAVGDCVAPRHTAIAIYEGEIAGRAVGQEQAAADAVGVR